MPGFSLGGAVNSAVERIGNAPVVRTVVNNPVLTALLITALVAVVIMGIYHRQIKAGGVKKMIRAGLYVFLLVTAVTFVHHWAVSRSAQNEAAHKGIRDVFSSIEQNRVSGGATPIARNWDETSDADAAAVAEVDGGCGCPLAGGTAAPATTFGAVSTRPDNLMLGGLDIEDVVLPTTTGPFHQ